MNVVSRGARNLLFVFAVPPSEMAVMTASSEKKPARR